MRALAQIHLLTVVSGAKCGGTSIDREFYRWCESKFGRCFTDIKLNLRTTGSKFMAEFEEVKCRFEGVYAGGEQEFFVGHARLVGVRCDDEDIHSIWDAEEKTIKITR